MKKIINISLVCLCSILFLASCAEDDAVAPKVTYYAQLELNGDEYMVTDMGQTFQDPGCTATMKGEDVSSQVVVSGNVDTSTAGMYDLTYSITNEDGISATVSRHVIVKHSSDNVAGVYYNTADSYRDYSGTISAFGAEYQIIVVPTDEVGVYEVDDLLGGWYCQRAGYGTSYAMYGTISVDSETGTVEALYGRVPGWNDSYDSFENGTFNANSGLIQYEVSYAGCMTFYISLLKM